MYGKQSDREPRRLLVLLRKSWVREASSKRLQDKVVRCMLLYLVIIASSNKSLQSGRE